MSKIIGVTVGTTQNPNTIIKSSVPEWARQPEKPTYTAKEVGALSSADVIDNLEYDENGDLVNGTKVTSANCVNRVVNDAAILWVKELESKADKTSLPVASAFVWDYEKYPKYIFDAIREGNSPFKASEFRNRNLIYFIDNSSEGEIFIFENFHDPVHRKDFQRITMLPDFAFHNGETITFIGCENLFDDADHDIYYTEINSKPLEDKVTSLETSLNGLEKFLTTI